jgi:excisionase family DNA binding protein
MSKSIRSATVAEQLLSVGAVAERLDTKPRFIRRLIAERRIEYHKVGRHVRIAESALAEFIEAGRVAPMPARSRGRAALCRASGVSGESVSSPSGRWQARYNLGSAANRLSGPRSGLNLQVSGIQGAGNRGDS